MSSEDNNSTNKQKADTDLEVIRAPNFSYSEPISTENNNTTMTIENPTDTSNAKVTATLPIPSPVSQ